ncbi:hypothetical protein SGFS_021390 [Streptomyces graminofaciens]|uniref:Uncharacterized protein n=1 Tax=Streptomyces graminofaciens TaxID=68212 RepID=A0ABN5VDQ3_9ACTN|nr:hypothetical protein [Streptomyces graminofaciens]BBC30845.1 hypothetical protein SGFS_021390 [Streptomyces graminofaciens]
MRTRASARQSRGIAQPDSLLRTLVGPVLCASHGTLSVLNPYWGDLGASFAWNNASYPPHGVENLGDDGTNDLADHPHVLHYAPILALSARLDGRTRPG